LERSNGYAGRADDRKFNPLVLGEIQTAADIQTAHRSGNAKSR